MTQEEKDNCSLPEEPIQDDGAIKKTPLNEHDYIVRQTKHCRQEIDKNIQLVKQLPASRETSLAITKLQEGVMWLGMNLKQTR